MPTIDFYFDFMSPYAYLAHTQLPGLARRFGYRLDYHPVDLVRTKVDAGNTGPSNRSIPRKIAYIKKDLDRWAAMYGVPIETPRTHDSELANLGVFVAADEGKATAYVNKMWSHAWGEGRDFTLEDIAPVASAIGLQPDNFLADLQSDAVRARYERSNLDAQAHGVFGVPTMIVEDEMWWGNDRLDFLEAHLAGLSGKTSVLRGPSQSIEQADA